MSSAFIIPLHILEVSTRNAVVEALEAIHTQSWPWNQGFVISLPNPNSGYSPRKDLQKVTKKQPTAGKVVAEMKFIFWEKMFTARHDGRIWETNIHSVFPNAPSTMSAAQVRQHIHDKVRSIRLLRNRIAHHEPIFSRQLEVDYQAIQDLVDWRNSETGAWMQNIQRVNQLLQSRPNP
ncbi:MAG: hypothetical protein AAGB13_16855 [Cyanobacteria bacterium P01_F01_bin.33]